MISPRLIKLSYFGGDLLTFVVALLISIHLFNNRNLGILNWEIFAGFILLWLLICYWRKLYFINFHQRPTLSVGYIKAYIVLLVIFLIFYLISPYSFYNIRALIVFAITFQVLGISINMLVVNYTDFAKIKAKKERFTLIAGVGNLAESVERQLNSQSREGLKVKGFIDCQKKESCLVGKDKVVGDLAHIHEYLRENPVDEIVIALPVKTSKKVRNIIEAADYHGVRVKYIPDYQGIFGKNYKITKYGQIDAVNVRQLPLDETHAFILKNSFDKVFATLALIALLPVFIVIALLIKLESPGPVFYCPIRIGKGGKPFKVYKFRSMSYNDTVSGGLLSTQKDDPRVTTIGRILRKYSLDELPQFMNVLIGNMSVVGPRPHRSFLNQQLQASVDKYMIRHYFKPGITGWAQVNGWRGPTETEEQRIQRTMHDLWYMENWSIGLDLKIIYRTIFSAKTHTIAF
ncbi:undecaprenyl-phosphate glucose phosphotransferase [Pontibacter pudoricolor]|uniref:undecaprenyl-phosphate glucose phosphotransferase n=1 Tax=Pontibacter pudoricolor TaxID=2694930 RepID=UPI0013914BC6|nr:undecaprenyl-phosphate glucose phosphotransferase [Pontibacter pudoricolor]